MNQAVTVGIVLSRINYGEADRILTVLTPNHGKLRLLAKGVRKSKSKMAGGVELFSVAEISYIKGKGDIHTLTSSRLKQHYGHIAKDIDRTMLGYDLLKLINKCTEDQTESDYFELLHDQLAALDDPKTPADIIKLWFYAQLLGLAGHAPNLQTDIDGAKLTPDNAYLFSYDDMAFSVHPNGDFKADHIKLLRLVFAGNKPAVLQQVSGLDKLLPSTLQLIQTILPNHLRV